MLLSQGTLGIDTNASLGDPANALQLGTDSATAGGLEFLASGVDVARPVAITLSAARVASNGSDINAISGPLSGGTLVKVGSGTLALTGTANAHAGTVVRAGVLQVAADASLGTGPVTVEAAGTLSFIGSTSSVRTFTLAGTLSVAAGQTLTLTNALVTGGVLAGPGTIATVAGASTTFAGTATATSLT